MPGRYPTITPGSGLQPVGVDVGHSTLATLSNGEKLNGTYHNVCDYIARSFSIVCVETLSIKGFARFMKYLERRCGMYGALYVPIPAYAPSTRTCSTCGKMRAFIPVYVREWTCAHCHSLHDRDINAAKNILAWGLKEALPYV